MGPKVPMASTVRMFFLFSVEICIFMAGASEKEKNISENPPPRRKNRKFDEKICLPNNRGLIFLPSVGGEDLRVLKNVFKEGVKFFRGTRFS